MHNLGWSSQRRMVAGAGALVALCSLLLPWIPVGMALWFAALPVVFLWPTVESGRYMSDTKGGAISEAVEAARKVMFIAFTLRPWRLGPEGDNDKVSGDLSDAKDEHGQPKDQLHEQDKSWFHPITLNSISAALTASIYVGLEMIISRGLNSIPWPRHWSTQPGWAAFTQPRGWWMLITSGAAGWVTAKAVAAWGRGRKDPGAAAPTVLIENAERYPNATWGGFIRAALHWQGIVAIVLCSVVGASLWIYVPAIADMIGYAYFAVIVPATLLIMGEVGLREWSSEQRNAWLGYKLEQRQWGEHWSALLPVRLPPPALAGYVMFPTHDENGEPMQPHFKRMVFTLGVGTKFETFLPLVPKLAPAIKRTLINILPGANEKRQPAWGWMFLDHETPAYTEWTQSRQTQWMKWNARWNASIDQATAYLDPQLHDETKQFLFQRTLAAALRDLKLGVLLSGLRMTVRSVGDAPVYIQWDIPLYAELTHAKLLARIPEIASKLGVAWLRIAPEGSTNTASCHLCLTHPDRTKFEPGKDRTLRHKIVKLDWSYWMTSAGLVGADGISTPELKSARIAHEEADDPDATIHELRFTLPEGLTTQDVVANLPKLRSASELGYVEIRTDTKSPKTFTLLAGRRDPLDADYLFSDYATLLLTQPVRGQPNITWHVGMGADRKTRVYTWEDDYPHLLIAGASGSGKSVVANSMLLQLLHNNDPADVEVWLLEPKNELQLFQHAEHVKVFIDANVADSRNIWEVAQKTYAAVAEEMERRYQLMGSHPLKPKKISECRELARVDPAANGELNFPYLFVVMEECTSYFARPPVKEYTDDHNKLKGHTEEIARKGRAAGVHLVFLTQNPVKDAIPTTIKRQCGKIGLRTADKTGSIVIIDAIGLESIRVQGRGIIKSGDSGEGFRSFYIPTDELLEHFNQVPKNRRWPKLPPGVEPSPIVDIIDED